MSGLSRERYSRTAQIVSAKEIGRSIGFATCDPEWAEIVFLAAQEVLYDFFGNDVGFLDIDLRFGSNTPDVGVPPLLRVKAIKRLFIAEDRAYRRCRLDKEKLSLYRQRLSADQYYDRRPRLAPPEPLTHEVELIAEKFAHFSGQHGWRVTPATVRGFLGQFPPKLREKAKAFPPKTNLAMC